MYTANIGYHYSRGFPPPLLTSLLRWGLLQQRLAQLSRKQFIDPSTPRGAADEGSPTLFIHQVSSGTREKRIPMVAVTRPILAGRSGSVY